MLPPGQKYVEGVGVTVPSGRVLKFTDITMKSINVGDEAFPSEINMVGSSQVIFKNVTVLESCNVRGPAARPFFEKCLLGTASLYGGAPRFEDCEFSYAVTFYNRNEGTFTGCIFQDKVLFRDEKFWTIITPLWSQSSSMAPTIEKNCFMGKYGLDQAMAGTPPLPIAIGPNYWGDELGPRYTGGPDSAGVLAGDRGAILRNMAPSSRYFSIAPPLKAGKQRRDMRRFPQFWLNNDFFSVAVGQITLPGGASIMGRDTLVSVDLVTSEKEIHGAQVYLMIDPGTGNWTRYEPTRPTTVLYRDANDYGRHGRLRALSTINFIVPPINISSGA